MAHSETFEWIHRVKASDAVENWTLCLQYAGVLLPIHVAVRCDSRTNMSCSITLADRKLQACLCHYFVTWD